MSSKRTGAVVHSRRPATPPAPIFPVRGTPPDVHGFPDYAAIGRANAAHRRRYEKTLAARRAAAATARRKAGPAAWRKHARETRTALADSLGVRLLVEPDPVAAPTFVRAASLMPDGVTTDSPSQFATAAALGTTFNLPAAGLDGDDIELLVLHSPAVGGPYPTLVWLPRAGDCLTGAQSPAAAAREFGHALAQAGWKVILPRLPAFEMLSIPTAKRRLLEGSSALGAIVAEAARVLTAALTLPGRDLRAGLFVGGADVGGLAAVCLAALDRRVTGVAALELPRLGDSTVHESLVVPRINTVADLAGIAALCAPRPLFLDRRQPLLDGASLTPLFRRLRGLPGLQIAADAGQAVARLSSLRARPLPPRRAADAAQPAACVGAPLPPARRFDLARPANRRAAQQNWPRRAAELRREFRDLLGIPAPTLPRAVREVGRVTLKDCTRIEYHLTTEPDCIVNLTWLRPHAAHAPAAAANRPAEPRPTILCLPGSGSDVAKVEKQFGHEVVARGWNAILIDGRVALYPFHPGIPERRAMIAQSLHDILTATQWVLAQPGVDPARVACMGVSQGGTHSWMLPALEPRLAAAAPVCGLCTYQSLIDNVRDERYDSAWRSFLDSHSIYYFVPGILDRFEQQDLCGLIAPRPLLMIGGDHDNCFPLDGMRAAARDLKSWYRLFHAEKNFQYIEFNGPHSMPLHTRESAYDFFRKVFARVGRS